MTPARKCWQCWGFDQRDVGQPLSAQRVAQPHGQLQTASAATNDDDAVYTGLGFGRR